MISYKTMQKEEIRDSVYQLHMVITRSSTPLFVKSHVFMSQSDSYGSKPSQKASYDAFKRTTDRKLHSMKSIMKSEKFIVSLIAKES